MRLAASVAALMMRELTRRGSSILFLPMSSILPVKTLRPACTSPALWAFLISMSTFNASHPAFSARAAGMASMERAKALMASCSLPPISSA